MGKNPIVLKLEPLDVPTATINRPLRVRGIETGSLHALEVFDLQRQQGAGPPYEFFQLVHDMHSMSLRPRTMKIASLPVPCRLPQVTNAAARTADVAPWTDTAYRLAV
jgi:hypothetical protein